MSNGSIYKATPRQNSGHVQRCGEGDRTFMAESVQRLITEITEESEGYQWGEIDTANEFQPLGEEQTIAMSLSVLQDYQKGKTGISGDRVPE